MFRNLFSLAVQGTLRKRRSSILIFSVLLLSFSCAIMSLSITESMHNTYSEYRYETFGEWYIALPYTKSGDSAWVKKQSWAKEIGTATVYASLYPETHSGSFGTIDKAYRSLGRVHLLEGRLPKTDNEVAVTETVLSLLQESQNTSFAIGDEVPIPATLMSEGIGVRTQKKYTLCGILQDYGELWSLLYNVNQCEPVSAVMTEKGAQSLLDKANAELQKRGVNLTAEPTEQLYIRVDRGERLDAAEQVKAYLQETRNAETEDVLPCVNDAAYPRTSELTSSDEIYAFLIAAVALVAVLCVYLMQLQSEVHSFAVLRSLGITKGQLLLLTAFESVLLAVPAVLLGIPLGAGLTWLALRLLVFSGSVAIQVAVPYSMLKMLFALWLVAILLARLVVFSIVVHTPLTGRMQMQERKARRATRLRRTLVVALLFIFCAVGVYSAGEALFPRNRIKAFSLMPDYVISNEVSSPEFAERLREIEGIDHVEGYMRLANGYRSASPIRISFEGLAERGTNLYMVDTDYWDDVLDFGDDREAFRSGEIVYLCFGEQYFGQRANGTQDSSVLYEWPDAPMPEGNVTLRVCTGSVCFSEITVEPRFRQRTDFKYSRFGLGISEPYTVICSQAFIQRLLDQMEAGTEWECFVAGEEFAYQSLWITADENAADLSAYYAVRTLVKKEFGNTDCLEDNSEEKQIKMKEQTQSLILLYACGGCVAVVTLLLLASALALEAEQERRSYSILRVIGMSKRQMRRRVFGKALWRSMFAIVAGWALYAVLYIRVQLALNVETLTDAVKSAWELFYYYSGGLPFVAILSAAMLAVLLCVSLLSKRGLKKGTLLK